MVHGCVFFDVNQNHEYIIQTSHEIAHENDVLWKRVKRLHANVGKSASVFASVTAPRINYSNWQMATGRLVFWPITNGHTAGLNRASFCLRRFSWRLSHSVTSQDPKQSHRHRWCCRSPPKQTIPKCVCLSLCYSYEEIFCGAKDTISSWFSLCVRHAAVMQTQLLLSFFPNWGLRHTVTFSWAYLKACIYVTEPLLCMGNKT